MTSSDKAPAPRPSRWRRWALEAAIFLVLFLAFLAFQAWQLRDAARGPAPAFVAESADGSIFDLEAWRAAHAGQPVLLYFWADWCPVCKTTAGSVGAIAGDWPVMGIGIQSGSPQRVAATLAERGYAYPSQADPSGDIHRQYGLPGVPAFVIIAPDGHVSASAVGYTSETGLRLRLWLAARENQ